MHRIGTFSSTGIASAAEALASENSIERFDKDGVLSCAAFEWIEGAALNPSRAASGPCALVAGGIHSFLQGAEPSKTDDVFFSKMRSQSIAGERSNMAAEKVIRAVQDLGIPVQVDIFHRDFGEPTSCRFLPHAKLVESLGAKVATEHPFEVDQLRAKLGELPVGASQMFFIDNHHVITIARDGLGLIAFDTALNPQNDYREHFRGTRASLEDYRRLSPHLFTSCGKKYLVGAEAEALIDSYLKEVRMQPIVVTSRARGVNASPWCI